MKYSFFLRSNIMFVLSGIITLLGFISCSDDKDYEHQLNENFILSEVSINETMNPLPLLIGKDTLLSYTVYPDFATDTSVIWKSGDTSIATVDEFGRVKALKEGEVFISLVPKVGNATSATIKINVINKIVYTENITITNTDLEVYETDQLQLNTVLVPADVTYFALKWSSANESIATVSEDGIVTGVKEGSVQITANATDGTNKSASVTITIKPVIPVEDVEIASALTELAKFETAKLEFSVTPANATASSLVWSSSNSEILVIENGLLKVKGAGTVTLTAKAEYADGSSIEKPFKITVPEGKVNDTFYYDNLWIPHSNNAILDIQNNKLLVTSVTQNASYYKIQFKRSVYTDLNSTNYSILAFKVKMTGNVSNNNPNYVLDVWGGDITGGKYKPNGGSHNNAMERFTANDGSTILYVRLNKDSGYVFGSSTLDDNKTSTIQNIIFESWEIASASSNPPVLEVSWMKTFKSVNDLNTYVNNE